MMQLMKKFKAIVRISRPINVSITFFSIIVGAAICINGYYFLSKIILAAVSGALISASGNIINDIFDLEIDKINRSDRVLVKGELKKNEAIIIYLIFAYSGIFVSSYINYNALAISTAASILLFLYSYKLKQIVLIGNIIVAAMTGLAFIYGGTAVLNINPSIIPALFAFLINFIREVVKDMEDIEGDTKTGVKTFPYKFGFDASKKLIISFSVLLILFTLYPFILKIYDIEYLIVILVLVDPILIYFLKSLLKDDSRKNLNKLSFILKLNMVFGLIAIFLG
jgi:geranylgeranylglycerol-phosphate geranylgeranyltransferase